RRAPALDRPWHPGRLGVPRRDDQLRAATLVWPEGVAPAALRRLPALGTGAGARHRRRQRHVAPLGAPLLPGDDGDGGLPGALPAAARRSARPAPGAATTQGNR